MDKLAVGRHTLYFMGSLLYYYITVNSDLYVMVIKGHSFIQFNVYPKVSYYVYLWLFSGYYGTVLRSFLSLSEKEA